MLLELSRSRRVLGLWILFPVAMLLLFGWVRVESLGGMGPALEYTAPGILIGAALFFSCLGGPVSIIVGERERGTLRRLLASPLTGGQYFIGLTVAHVAIAMGQAGLVYGITYAAGGRFAGSLPWGVLVLLLSTGAYVGVGFIIGTRFASGAEEINGTVAGVGVPLLVLGGTFFSADALPPLVYAAAWLNPVFHMNQAFTGVARSQVGMGDVWPSVVLLGVFAVGSVWLGARSYNRMLTVSAAREEKEK
jgi:ABC-2 type transport system permease protein